MALSNIRNEPRREITESLFGVVAFLVVLFLDYFGAKLFYNITGGSPGGCPWPVGMVAVPLVLFIGVAALLLLAYGTHSFGEFVCGKLARVNLDPRPKNRPGRR